MAHELEMVEGNAAMAYVGEVPWHGLGVRVPPDLTPKQMLKAAKLNWEVQKIPGFYTDLKGKQRPLNQSALVRVSDNKLLDIVSDEWNPVQNHEAFEFFNDFIAAGEMHMETAGALYGGKIVWALAKVNDSFELFGGDRVESYLQFSNFHQYGFSTDVRFTAIRTVCNNTFNMALGTKVGRMVKYSHRRVFQPEEVKEVIGITKEKLAKYKEVAAYLGSRKASDENIVDYFTRIFPVTGSNPDKIVSKNAMLALNLIHLQPGSEFAKGTWWQPFNAVTYITDHLIGRSADTRLRSAWYGQNKNLKAKALELALKMAKA